MNSSTNVPTHETAHSKIAVISKPNKIQMTLRVLAMPFLLPSWMGLQLLYLDNALECPAFNFNALRHTISSSWVFINIVLFPAILPLFCFAKGICAIEVLITSISSFVAKLSLGNVLFGPSEDD